MMARFHTSACVLLLAVGCGPTGQSGVTPSRSTSSSELAAAAAPLTATAIRCGPAQQALLTQELIGGQVATVVSCTAAAAAPESIPGGLDSMSQQAPLSSAAHHADAPSHGRPESTAYGSSTRPPASSAARPVRIASVDRYGDEEIVRIRPRERSWQKRALVIGGATGVGAGVGAVAGGKKGALIGAAIGAGGATLYEARK